MTAFWKEACDEGGLAWDDTTNNRAFHSGEIAATLNVSVNTIRNHVQSVLAKLGAHSKLEAVSTAVREGIIDYPTASNS